MLFRVVVVFAMLSLFAQSNPTNSQGVAGKLQRQKRLVNHNLFSLQSNAFIVNLTNQERSRVAASNMHKLVWDALLTNQAFKYAQNCTTEKVFTTKYMAELNNTGAVFRFIMANPVPSLAQMLTLVLGIGQTYNYTSNACNTTSSLCADYRTMVRGESKRMGCAISLCGMPYNAVCFYAPSGNNTERPYIAGVPCSLCPREYICENNLCVFSNTSIPQPTTAIPSTTAMPSTASSPNATTHRYAPPMTMSHSINTSTQQPVRCGSITVFPPQSLLFLLTIALFVVF